ncbi:MAG: 6,7-dimethyl-8-ribityllumazine synthase [Pseudomonadota bacterium]|nr:6,7-dimethyl-8-ribityllumazine synthase [Pseudomonadota bacterium]
MSKKIYIINANYYEEISSRLLKGAISYCKNNKIDYQVVEVPGALEIPSAINIINRNEEFGRVGSVGYIALGCIIKGETSHYDVVVYESAYGLTELSISKNIILSNSILTVDNHEQAIERSKDDESNKGYRAAEACSRLIDIENGKI